MRKTTLTMPELMLIAGTRVALGIGIGFLLTDKLKKEYRRGAGYALLAVGALSTIPLAIDVISRSSIPESITE